MTEKSHRHSIDIAFADDDQQFREGLRSALTNEGFTLIRDCSSLDKLRRAFESTTPDLLLIDTQMEGGKALAFIPEIRQGQLGKNPFVTIIATIAETDKGLIHRIIESGVDDLLLKPISTDQLIQRIGRLAEERQKFVVTTDYIGPQRRREGDREESEEGLNLDLIEVPNTLGAKARGETIDDDELLKFIQEAQAEINDQRLKRNAYGIAILVRDILPAYGEDRVDEEIRAKVVSLAEYSKDVGERLIGTPYLHVSDLCDVLASIAAALRDGSPDPKNIALLKPLSDAVNVSFNPQPDTETSAEEIVSLVRQYIKEGIAEAKADKD